MPSITDNPPQNVQNDLNSLSAALDAQIPNKSNDNLLIASWNIRSFASLTRKWTASASDSPKRDFRGLRAIIEILSRFDVIAIQELKGDLRALRDTLRFLGDDWGFLMTDVTLGDEGNDERLAYMFNRTRVQPSGLAAELVVPPDRLDRIDEGALREQFARTPYAVSFRRGNATFILATLHIIFGEVSADRIPELNEIADFFRDWAKRSNRWHHNLICLGDFNIDRHGDERWQAFTSTGLTVPTQLHSVKRSIFAQENDPMLEKYYDQIAWFDTGSHRRLKMDFVTAGGFDFVPYTYTETEYTKQTIQHRLSDHSPLWAEFNCQA